MNTLLQIGKGYCESEEEGHKAQTSRAWFPKTGDA